MKARGIMIAGTAALAACSVLGMALAAAQASSASTPTWTQQHPATSPLTRSFAVMADDAATGTVVLFGGASNSGSGQNLGDTWTWNGTTWTKQAPPVHPSARSDAAMAYDAATRTVVLFGGLGRGVELADTWTWNGTTWTKQHPAVSPPAQATSVMAYDAATRTIVLFDTTGATWTWNGTTWTKQHTKVHPIARSEAVMAYDAATGTVVLFGGFGNGGVTSVLGDTWTWDGKKWTQQHPAASPPGRILAAMAYDAAIGTVVLFGGEDSSDNVLGDTWTWDGTTWTQQHPATSPPARVSPAMAEDAATGTTVLFGGFTSAVGFGDTWTWGRP